ncbi:peptidoglycan-binding domain-containing protein [Streptomyces alboflavus]|uniref:peptidoglycan-binding domain-containing protein n=1 Tax=Streptomyces alboflavus TaxID=67267 RepID=UPI000A9EF8C3|nr:peptidoglycan-binding domain-containing protein [Streptomyces alboflavus]
MPDSAAVPADAEADAGAGPDEPAAEPSPRRRRPMRTSLVVLAATAVAGAGGLAATGTVGGDGTGTSEAAQAGPARTAAVEKRTLTRGETVEGTLGYGEATPVRAGSGGGAEPGAGADAKGGGSPSGSEGTLTWLPDEGEVLERGDAVYAVDEKKVPLLYGSTPLYRTLGAGAEGNDVRLLEKNLAALGHTGFTVDDTYSAGTARAVKDWQRDLGRDETGEVAPGDAVVASGARRVDRVESARGDSASGDVLTWTGTRRTVTVDLEARYEDLVEEGTKATVALPDGTEAEARVTDVGSAATAEPAEGGDSDGGADEATLPVELTVKDQKKLGRYQAAPVDVTLAAETRQDVLAVPVDALVARKGGGYAVQAVTGSAVEYRPVELGMFAGGMVEVSGDGITEGLKVAVPK